MSRRSLPHLVTAGLALVAGAASLLAPVARADAEVDTRRPVYVALGDSYTSGPLLSKPAGTWGGDGPGWANPENPYTCGKSDRNYPHLVAKHLGLYDPDDLTNELGEHPAHPGFIDISCGSATTDDMWSAQEGLPGGGSNPPQLSAFDRVDAEHEVVKLVTLGVGGNDLGFGELTDYCIQPPQAVGGTPCRIRYEETGVLQTRLAQLRVDLEAVIREIQRLAPEAEVLVFGYPALLPEERDLPVEELRNGCYPYIPILPTDAAYLREVEKDLNSAIAEVATARGAHYVDWYTPSIGHDMCQPPGVAWVNGVVLAPPSFPVHPNVLGTMGGARAAVAVLEAIEFELA